MSQGSNWVCKRKWSVADTRGIYFFALARKTNSAIEVPDLIYGDIVERLANPGPALPHTTALLTTGYHQQ